MNKLKVFHYQENDVRTVEKNGEVLFCGADVAGVLGYSNARDSLSRHCRGVVKRDIPTESGMQEMSLIPESDLYRLVFRSKLPTAEKFTDWVTAEVLPSIRRHGGYIAGQEQMSRRESGRRIMRHKKAGLKAGWGECKIIF